MLRLSPLNPRLNVGIAQKIGIAFLALFMIAVMNIVLVEGMMARSDRTADTVNVAGKLRMLSMRIALQTVSAGHGVGGGAAEIHELMADFDSALQALSRGGYVFGLYVDSLSAVHARCASECGD